MKKIILILVATLMMNILLLDAQAVRRPKRTSSKNRINVFTRFLFATSEDGLNWIKNNEVVVDRALSPGALFDGENMRLYFFRGRDPSSLAPTKVFVMISRNGLQWDEKKVDVLGLPDGMSVEDPCVVFLPSGKYRMYYYEHPHREGRPLSRSSGFFIMASAISEDGINFLREAGERFVYGRVMDPDVIQMGDVWRMFLSEDGRIVSAISYDNGSSFVFEKYIPLDGFITSTLKVPGGYRMYYQKRSSDGESQMICSAFSTDGIDWTKDPGVRIEEKVQNRQSRPSGGNVMSMAVARNDTGYWMFYASKPKDSR